MKLKLIIKHIIMIGLMAISLLLSTASIGLAQVGAWDTTKTDMLTARWALSTSAVDGKIYAFGGYSTDHALDTVEEYDCATDTWTKKKNMRTACMGFSTSMVNGKIYIIGGRVPGQSLRSVYEYDPVTDTYTSKTDMPTPRVYLSTSVVNDKIYAIGGSQNVDAGLYSKVEVYDPATDTWTTKTPMREGARSCLSSSVVNGKIYVIGGWDGNVTGTGLSTVEEYDPATDTWTTKTPMSTPRVWLSTSVVDGKIYAIGGISNYIPYSTVEVYDPATDTWYTDISPMPTARSAFSTSEVDGEIYAIGGQINHSGPPWDPGLKTVEKFDPLKKTSVKNIYGIQNNPTKFLLHQNYPNPFNPQTMIEYQLPQTCRMRLVIYNLIGQKIATLLDQSQSAGQFNVVWDGKDSYGRIVPSGVYFYRLETKNFSEMKSMILLE